MIRNGNRQQILAASSEQKSRLTPRLAALLRESWWLLAVVGFIYLALILSTYQRSDPGWSFSGTGEALHNKGGVVGAWLADLLLYLFGFSSWWLAFAGLLLIIGGYRRLTQSKSDADSDPHHVWLAIPGFLLLLIASSGLEALRL